MAKTLIKKTNKIKRPKPKTVFYNFSLTLADVFVLRVKSSWSEAAYGRRHEVESGI